MSGLGLAIDRAFENGMTRALELVDQELERERLRMLAAHDVRADTRRRPHERCYLAGYFDAKSETIRLFRAAVSELRRAA